MSEHVHRIDSSPEGKEKRRIKALEEAVREAPTRVGETLHNGGIILAIKEIGRDERMVEFMVLCCVPKQFQPFVSWRYDVGITETATSAFASTGQMTWSGDYSRDLGEAYAVWKKRAGVN